MDQNCGYYPDDNNNGVLVHTNNKTEIVISGLLFPIINQLEYFLPNSNSIVDNGIDPVTIYICGCIVQHILFTYFKDCS
ncbi:hypothetical protein DERP_013226 [Dermatophagoides pteronyssinus]|uniref:Uncharacterized protein n=1 Tax=Dermatophagoides pteronyssinus TaxID=6956 RepID=A0ABQ8IRV3_DERPT|nr:hypothetical protein DERP_013226 [Dermatophagoides pteronyssinus]